MISKIYQYADDAFLTILNDKESIEEVFQTIESFTKISGLFLNIEKTEVLHVGPKQVSEGVNLEWIKENVTLLGCKICSDRNDMIDLNYKDKLQKVEKCLKNWSCQDLY